MSAKLDLFAKVGLVCESWICLRKYLLAAKVCFICETCLRKFENGWFGVSENVYGGSVYVDEGYCVQDCYCEIFEGERGVACQVPLNIYTLSVTKYSCVHVL